jgi:hypothetical protein
VVVNRRVEIVVLAAVDDTLGRAVAQLGQDGTTSGSTSGDASGRAHG